MQVRVTAAVEQAPAKINLTLRVLGRRADGYHELESLVAFADVADTLTLAAGRDAHARCLRSVSPRPAARPADNLVLKALDALAQRVDGLKAGRFTLDEESAGRGRHRRRLGRRGGGVAAAGARQRHRARRSAAAPRPRSRSAPTCRSASNRARASCAASAKSCRRRWRCRRCRRCWSIRACRWRRATCSPNSLGAPGGREVARRRAGDADALIDYLAAPRQRPDPGRDRLRAGDRRCARRAARAAGRAAGAHVGLGPTCFALFGSRDEAAAAAQRLKAVAPGLVDRATSVELARP